MESILNPAYLKKETIDLLEEAWKKEKNFSHVLLTKIFKEETHIKKEKVLKHLFYKHKCEPHLYSHATAKATALHIFDNKELHAMISQIIQQKVHALTGYAYLFSWKDYMLIKKEKPGIDIIFDYTENWQEEWGGALMYKNDHGKYLKFLPRENTLIIIERKNTQRYIQYVNNLSRGKKRYLLLASIK